MTDSTELSKQILQQMAQTPANFTVPPIEEKFRRNAGRVMQEIIRQRLQSGGVDLVQQKNSRYAWGDGVILNRNSRVGDLFWTNLPPTQITELMQVASEKPSVFLFCFFDTVEKKIDCWALPDKLAFRSFATITASQSGPKNIVIDRSTNRLRNAGDSPDLTPHFQSVSLTAEEVDAIAAAIKQDAASKEILGGDDGDEEPSVDLSYSQATVDYSLALCDHTNDGVWHKKNKIKFQQVLRDPTIQLINSLRTSYIQGLDADVANTTNNVSKLKKNDWGQGGYYDHFWAAFYDPSAKSKTQSCQLFLGLLGKQREFNYGFAFGQKCEEYIEKLGKAINDNRASVAAYLDTAPAGTVAFASKDTDDSLLALLRDPAASSIEIKQDFELQIKFPIENLPDRSAGLVDEIGKFFVWVWPFFQASRTGQWSIEVEDPPPDDNESDEIDDSPQTLSELSSESALPLAKLQEIEDALLAKQQVILTGPPGTSKTYIAQLFARYFVGEHDGQLQGSHSTVFMHANWGYEDFFEGIKPFTENGVLKFEPKLGCFLEWIDSLRSIKGNTRHVLILDEINRCDTAAVLGELLQLMEYRGRPIRLLSGRIFRFPNNVFIIGTMNSADRSIGRMDLALRRRFLWVDLYPDYDVLSNWLGREGNNPAKFRSNDLRLFNQLLEERGIPTEQHVGHALFMLQTFGSESQPSVDKPLVAEALRRIVRFSVILYVRELCVIQFGRSDTELVSQVETILLNCLNAAEQDSIDDESSNS